MGLSDFEFDTTFGTFNESGSGTDHAYCRIRSDHTGPHTSNTKNTVAILTRPVGSGALGPAFADYTLCLSNIKKDWTNQAVAASGEIDGMKIAVRQGGPAGGGSDAAGILLNVANLGNSGFAALWEGSLNNYSYSGGLIANYTAQLTGGSFDGPTGNAYGYTFRLSKGHCNDGVRISLENASVSITYAFHYIDNGVTKFSVSEDGTVFSAAGVKVGASKVVGPRDTGWTLMSGTANKSSALDTANATISQLAERVKALEAALAAHGLIGA